MKIAVIGCTHAGTAAIIKAKELNPKAEITVYERNDNISFLSCGIALHIGGIVKDPESLFYSSPRKLLELGVNTKMKHEVLKTNLENNILTIKDLKTGNISKEEFDKLIITSGSWPVIPKIQGIELENILLCKNYDHAKEIVEKSESAENIIVIGAGYIGVELAESFQLKNKNVTLIDGEKRILSKYLDKDITDIAEAEMKENGINIICNETVCEFEGKNGEVEHVQTNSGKYKADLVILCIGFKPNTILFEDQLEMMDNGAIIVDEYMQTSVKDVYAAGDCCAVTYNPLSIARYIPLATNAVRMGTLAALNLSEKKIKHPGTQGTSGIKIYNYNISSTGLTLDAAISEGLNATSLSVEDNNRPEFMPEYHSVELKIVYSKDSNIILGAQICSKQDMTQMMNTLSIAIQNKMRVEDLAFSDFFFQPHFNKPWNLLSLAGLKVLA